MNNLITLGFMELKYKRNCPSCGKKQTYSRKDSLFRAIKNNRMCINCSMSGDKNGFFGKTHNINTKNILSNKSNIQWNDLENRKNKSIKTKLNWQNAEKRKNYIKSLSKSKWLKVRCDIGQPEFIEKWNRLGFNFEMNYQLTDNNGFLAYLDGYDKQNNIVLEYDGIYHNNKKDLIRQNKIIELLKPKKFFRFNKKTNTIYNTIAK